MTVKQHVAYEVSMVLVATGAVVSAVVGGAAALSGQVEMTQTAVELSVGLFLVFIVGCLAAVVQAQGPYAVCAWCGKSVPEAATERGIDGRLRCSGQCPQPTRWMA